ncbi:MAG: hypothetical protein R6U86_10030, partial [Bacteroidales bacterium]
MDKVPTYNATIYVGCKERDTGFLHSLDEVKAICQEYCDEIGLCVTVTATDYIYTNGHEPGAIIGFINYPRFPSAPEQIRKEAMELAYRLLRKLNQYRISIVFS